MPETFFENLNLHLGSLPKIILRDLPEYRFETPRSAGGKLQITERAMFSCSLRQHVLCLFHKDALLMGFLCSYISTRNYLFKNFNSDKSFLASTELDINHFAMINIQN